MPDLQPEKPSVSPKKGIELLRQQQGRFNLILDDAHEFNIWIKLTRLCMEKAFGKNHPNVGELLSRSISNLGRGKTSSSKWDSFLAYWAKIAYAQFMIVGVEMPSDLGGILYIPYDAPSGRWRWDVAKEIQAAGSNVDLNKL